MNIFTENKVLQEHSSSCCNYVLTQYWFDGQVEMLIEVVKSTSSQETGQLHVCVPLLTMANTFWVQS